MAPTGTMAQPVAPTVFCGYYDYGTNKPCSNEATVSEEFVMMCKEHPRCKECPPDKFVVERCKHHVCVCPNYEQKYCKRCKQSYCPGPFHPIGVEDGCWCDGAGRPPSDKDYNPPL